MAESDSSEYTSDSSSDSDSDSRSDYSSDSSCDSNVSDPLSEETYNDYHAKLLPDFLTNMSENMDARVSSTIDIINEHVFLLLRRPSQKFKIPSNFLNKIKEIIKPSISLCTKINTATCSNPPQSLKEYKKLANNALHGNKKLCYFGDYIFGPIIYGYLYQHIFNKIHSPWSFSKCMSIFLDIFIDILENTIQLNEKGRFFPIIPYRIFQIDNKFTKSSIFLLKHFDECDMMIFSDKIGAEESCANFIQSLIKIKTKCYCNDKININLSNIHGLYNENKINGDYRSDIPSNSQIQSKETIGNVQDTSHHEDNPQHIEDSDIKRADKCDMCVICGETEGISPCSECKNVFCCSNVVHQWNHWANCCLQQKFINKQYNNIKEDIDGDTDLRKGKQSEITDDGDLNSSNLAASGDDSGGVGAGENVNIDRNDETQNDNQNNIDVGVNKGENGKHGDEEKDYDASSSPAITTNDRKQPELQIDGEREENDVSDIDMEHNKISTVGSMSTPKKCTVDNDIEDDDKDDSDRNDKEYKDHDINNDDGSNKGEYGESDTHRTSIGDNQRNDIHVTPKVSNHEDSEKDEDAEKDDDDGNDDGDVNDNDDDKSIKDIKNDSLDFRINDNQKKYTEKSRKNNVLLPKVLVFISIVIIVTFLLIPLFIHISHKSSNVEWTEEKWLRKHQLLNILPNLKEGGFNRSLWTDITSDMLEKMNIKDSDKIRFYKLQKELEYSHKSLITTIGMNSIDIFTNILSKHPQMVYSAVTSMIIPTVLMIWHKGFCLKL